VIIDVHTHPTRQEGDRILSPEEAGRVLLREMDLAGVTVSALLGFNVTPGKSIEQLREINDYSVAIVCAYPDRLFALAFVNPRLPRAEVERELDRCLSNPAFKGIKLELDMNCRDRQIDYVAEKAREYNVPVLQHSWYVNCWLMGENQRRNQQHRSEPHDVACLARRFPDVRFIMAHLEGCGVRGILDVADCPNVWIDTSGSQPFSGTIEYGIETLGAERILFGSDIPFRCYESQYGRIIGSRMSDADRTRILYRNAAALFNIPL